MIPKDAPVFVHSDLGRGLLAAKRAGASFKAGEIQERLVDFLSAQVDGGQASLVFPAFNYDYGGSRLFDMDTDPVQVGALPEWVRKSGMAYRSEVPFFSFLSGVDLALKRTDVINPFGADSGFQWLVNHDATLLLFGAPIHSLTFIHYVEEMSGKPLYRYDKSFPGQIAQHGATRDCDLTMHVRPMGVHLDYDWRAIEADLRSADILRREEYSADLQWLNTRSLLEFWGNKLSADPLALIDQRSRAHFEEATDGGCKRVTLEDYENV